MSGVLADENEVQWGSAVHEVIPTGMWITQCQKIVQESVANENQEETQVLVFQDATIVSPRKLDKDELGKLGLVQTHGWGSLEAGNLYARCSEEFDRICKSSKAH